MHSTEIVVIGGGAAGVAAAHHIHNAGRQCLLLEARDRLGGRGWTVSAGGETIDLGCGWLHSADGNPWSQIAVAQGRTIDRSLPYWQRPNPPLSMTSEQYHAFRRRMGLFFTRLSEAAARDEDIAAAELFEPGERWNGLLRSVISYITGADAEALSVRDFENYEDSGVNWRVEEGYGAVVAAHPVNVPTMLGCTVTRIDHSGRPLRVETNKGVIEAEKAVVTLPTNIIAQSQTFFSPALPEKIEAACGLPLGLADKLYLSLDTPEEFARDTRLFGGMERLTGSYTLHAFGRPQIECYFGASLAVELERGGERAFVAQAMEDLTNHLGSDFGKRVRFLALHCWGADPFARGSYSFALPGRADKRAVLAAPVDERLFFAGEACSVGHFSTAHGAYRIGIAAAELACR
jgi:monoamine oxidase